MRVVFNQETYPDWEQRYTGCYGQFTTDKGKTKLIRFLGVDDHTVQFCERDEIPQFVTIDSDVSFDFPTLERRWWNTAKDEPVLTIRIPRRQWKRGISRENCAVGSYTGERRDSIFFDTPCFSTLTTCLEASETPTKSYLSRYFVVFGSSVFFLDRKVGTVDVKNRVFKVLPLFSQEIFDVVVRHPIYSGYKVEKK